MTYVMGVDLGTSSLKIIIVDKKGKIVDQGSSSYVVLTEQPGFSEQNPQAWLDAFDNVFDQFDKELINKVEGISVSGQMHSLVLLDEDHQVIRNAILWNDTRTKDQCDKIEEKVDILNISGNVAIEGFTLPKILWVQEHEPEIWSRVHKILLPKDYLNFYLTGEIRMDYSDASGTLMMALEQQDWSQEVLDMFDIKLDQLPKLIHSHDLVGQFQHINVYGGGADNACGSLATGLYDAETAMLSIGTSGVFLSLEEDNTQDYKGSLHYFSHAIPNTYYSMGVTLSAGHSLSWLKNILSPNEKYDAFLEPVASINQLDSTLLFTPYIMGERTPYRDSKVRGSFIGLDTMHSADHMKLAVLQGITCSLRDSYEIMKANNKVINKIISVGGGARNDLWLQLQADLFNIEVSTLSVEEGPAFGAAMIASVGLSWFKTFEECTKAFVSIDKTFYPRIKFINFYNEYYEKYQSIYSHTKEF